MCMGARQIKLTLRSWLSPPWLVFWKEDENLVPQNCQTFSAFIRKINRDREIWNTGLLPTLGVSHALNISFLNFHIIFVNIFTPEFYYNLHKNGISEDGDEKTSGTGSQCPERDWRKASVSSGQVIVPIENSNRIVWIIRLVVKFPVCFSW